MVIAFVALFVVWIGLTRQFDPSLLALGAAAAAGVTYVQRRLFPVINLSLDTLIRRPGAALRLLVAVAWRFMVSTLYTSYLILFARVEGRIVVVPTAVRDPFAQFILLDAITFTPSTISLLLDDDLLYVHWLRRKGSDWDWRGVKELLEKKLNAVFRGEG